MDYRIHKESGVCPRCGRNTTRIYSAETRTDIYGEDWTVIRMRTVCCINDYVISPLASAGETGETEYQRIMRLVGLECKYNSLPPDNIKEEDEVDHYFCGNCKFYGNCKRIDHKIVRFAVPWFKCYDEGQHSGIICCEFEPASWCVHACKVWKGFGAYWKAYVEQWLPYKNTDITISFILNEIKAFRYQVPLLDYVYGKMFDKNKLKAVSRTYCKRDKKSQYGYTIIKEPIDGVIIDGVEEYQSAFQARQQRSE